MSFFCWEGVKRIPFFRYEHHNHQRIFVLYKGTYFETFKVKVVRSRKKNKTCFLDVFGWLSAQVVKYIISLTVLFLRCITISVDIKEPYGAKNIYHLSLLTERKSSLHAPCYCFLD